MLKVLMVSSDNNATSGAFLCMAQMAKIMRDMKMAEVSVVLPYKNAEGEAVLDGMQVPFRVIRSYDWVTAGNWSKQPLKYTMKQFIKWPIVKIINLIAEFKLLRLIKKERYEIIHENTSWGYVGAVAARIAHIPFVWHIREMLEEFGGNKIVVRRLGYRLMDKSDAVITVSNRVFDKYRVVLRTNRLMTIYEGIDKNRFFYNRSLCFADRVNIAIVGGVCPGKNQFQLIRALLLVHQKGYRNVYVTLAGGIVEEYKKEIDAFLQGNNLSESVSFVGKRTDIETVYRSADISVICSGNEAFGRVTVEAMMSGCLMIGINAGGTKEIVTDRKTGLLYDGTDESLAELIIWALNNVEEANTIAKKGQQYVLEHFTSEANAISIYDVYQQIKNDVIAKNIIRRKNV